MTIPRVRVAVLGAGIRGISHSRRIRRAGGVITAIAEPDARRRERLAAYHDVPAEACFTDWRELARRAPDRADAVLITTQDPDHAEPCVRFARLGRHRAVWAAEHARRTHTTVTLSRRGDERRRMDPRGAQP